MEGSKRRLSSKRSTRKQLGSSPTASCYSADYEVTEVLHFQGRPHLPSPFQLFAVQLPFQGRLPRSERGFSVAMWICLNSPILGNGVDDVFKHTSEDSQRQLGNSMERTMLSRRERIVHLCSVGSGKSLFEIWTFPSNRAVLIRYVWVIRECQRGKTDQKKKMNRSINYATTTITFGGKKAGTKATTARKIMCLDSCERWRGLSGSSADSIITFTLFFLFLGVCVCLFDFVFVFG